MVKPLNTNFELKSQKAQLEEYEYHYIGSKIYPEMFGNNSKKD